MYIIASRFEFVSIGSVFVSLCLPVICFLTITCREMAAPPARARADYDYLIKLLLIGDSGRFLHSDRNTALFRRVPCILFNPFVFLFVYFRDFSLLICF